MAIIFSKAALTVMCLNHSVHSSLCGLFQLRISLATTIKPITVSPNSALVSRVSGTRDVSLNIVVGILLEVFPTPPSKKKNLHRIFMEYNIVVFEIAL